MSVGILIHNFLSCCFRNSDVVEIKNSVRSVAPHSGSDPKECPWVALAPMAQPRIGHGLVEAGKAKYDT